MAVRKGNSGSRLRRLSVWIFSALVTAGCAKQGGDMDIQAGEAQLLRKPYVSHVDNLEREYFVYLPQGYAEDSAQQWPVLFFLHGNGERGDGQEELDYVLSHGPLYEVWAQKRNLPFIIVAPQLHMFGMDKKADYIANRTREQIPQRMPNGTPAREYFEPNGPMFAGDEVSNWEEVEPLLPAGWDRAEQDLVDILQDTVDNLRVDKRRIYLTGISYGGFGTWYLASRYPEKFAAIAPVVGWAHPEQARLIAEANLPVWAFAGGRDEAVEKSYFYTGMNLLDQNSKADIRFTVHEDMSHDVWRRVYEGQDLYSWLLSHSASPRQATVDGR